jgi:acetyl esterase/lipase
MAESLASADAEHELVVVPGAAHSFDRMADQREAQDAIDRSLRFLRRHLDSPLA